MGARYRNKPSRKGVSGGIDMRSRQYWIAGAPYGNWGPFASSFEYYPNYEEMWDSTQSPPYADTNWEHHKCDLQVGSISGISEGPAPDAFQFRFHNRVLGPSSHGDAETGHLAPLAWSGPWDYINQALARNNPNRPDVNLYNLIYELRELPALLRDIGQFVLGKQLNKAPIAYQFGVAPLLSDLQALLNAAETIDRRIASVNRLRKKVRSERFKLDSNQISSSSGLRDEGAIYYRYERTTRLEVWCVKKHTITQTEFSPPKPFDKRSAFNLAFTDGLSLSVWNALPWSWLVDYFFGVADFLAATGNRIPGYKVVSICIMHKLETDMSHRVVGRWNGWSGNSKIKPMKGKRVSHRRLALIDPVAVFPTMKILHGGQVLTLLSLALARASGGKPSYGRTR